jgi:hypothetical protein
MKFLKDVIPVSENHNNNNNAAATTNSQTSRPNKQALSATCGSTMMNTVQSAKSISERSAQKAAAARQTISQEPYRRSVHSETEYGVNNREIDRKVENKIVSTLHGKQSGSSYFHVPKNAQAIASTTKGANLVNTGFTAKMK